MGVDIMVSILQKVLFVPLKHEQRKKVSFELNWRCIEEWCAFAVHLIAFAY